MTQRISVALPVHNGENFVEEAVESVLAQTHGDFTLVVSDNASSDQTPALLADYERRDPRVTVSRTETFLSAAENITRAIDLCDSDWVKPLCHDDRMEPHCLARLGEIIDSPLPPTVGLVGHAESWLFTDGSLKGPTGTDEGFGVFAGRDVVRQVAKGRSDIQLPSVTTAFVRMSAWRQGGGFDKRYRHCDTFRWLRMLMDWDYAYVPSPLTINRIHPSQVAVEARASAETPHENQEFWDSFLSEFGPRLGLTSLDRVKNRFRGAATSSSNVAVELSLGNHQQAFAALKRIPVAWWPAVPPLVLRSYVRARRRAKDLAEHVDLSLVFPSIESHKGARQ